MGQKEEIIAAMEYDSLTISEIYERIPKISKEQIRTLLHRLKKEGKIKEIGERLNQKVYRINNYYFTQSNSPDIDIDQYPDINVDLQALQITEQLITGPIKNFLENPKIPTVHLGIKNSFVSGGFGIAEERDLIQPRANVILKTLFEIQQQPAIKIYNQGIPFGITNYYYVTKISDIFWYEEVSDITSYNLVRRIPTKSLKSNKIINGPKIYLGQSRDKFDFYSDAEISEYREEKRMFEEDLKNSEKGGIDNIIAFKCNIFQSKIKPKLLSQPICKLDNINWFRSPIKGIKCIGCDIYPVLFEENEAARSNRFESVDFTLFFDNEDNTGNENLLHIVKDHDLHKFYCFLSCTETNREWNGCELTGKWRDWFFEKKHPRKFIQEYFLSEQRKQIDNTTDTV